RIEEVLEIEPAPFDFGELFDQPLNTVVEGEEVTLSFAPQIELDIAVTNGEYSLNDGDWTMAAGRANNGDRVKPRHTTPGTHATLTTTVVEVGTTTGVFESTTTPASPPPPTVAPATFAAAVRDAGPGDTLVLEDGDYGAYVKTGI